MDIDKILATLHEISNNQAGMLTTETGTMWHPATEIREAHDALLALHGHAEAMADALGKVNAWKFAKEPLQSYRAAFPRKP